jgi:apolipoprotein N-acyltransferase
MTGFTQRLHYKLRLLDEWQAWLVCFLAGAASALAFAPMNAFYVLPLTLPLLYLLLDAASSRRGSVLRGFFFGYGYAMAGTYWIAYALAVDIERFGWLIPISTLGLSAVMAWPYALLGVLFWWRRSGDAFADLLRFLVLWVLLEYARSLGMFGFPWNLLGYAALPSLSISQLAAFTGPYGLSLLVLAVALVPLAWIKPGISRRMAGAYSLLVVGLLLASVSMGAARIPPEVEVSGTRLRLVQPNIPQRMKWTQEGRIQSLRVHAQLSQQPSETPDGIPPTIIWSETAMPFTLYPESVWPSRLSGMLPPGRTLITGAVRAETRGLKLNIWNSIVVIENGIQRAAYDKHQLVPFGEFVPLRSVLPLEKITPGSIDFSRGVGAGYFRLGALPPYSALVCYEVIFPWIAIDAGRRPAWLLNVTNDAWYGDSPGPYQHFATSRFRAIEQGLPMVRVANTGISGIIDPYGRVVQALPLGTQGVMDGSLPQPAPATPYGRYHEWPMAVLLLGLWLAGGLRLWLKKS